jgi:redox-sensitive bicupin YhaK (pirin superfamily)
MEPGAASTIQKPVLKRFRAPQLREGKGFVVRRAIGGGDLSEVETDPFLLLDELPRVEYLEGEHPGAPMHPRHGILAFCYIKEGEYSFSSSVQMAGTLTAGDCQWANAGAGMKMEEKSPGGPLHGFQCFVNLPRALKSKPASVRIAREKIVQCNDLVTARLLAGECVGFVDHQGDLDGAPLGKSAPVRVQANFIHPGGPQHQMHVLDFLAAPGGRFEHVLPESMTTAIVYIYKGSFAIGPQSEKASAGDVCLLWDRGSSVYFCNTGDEEGGVVLVAGTPVREPTQRAGPIVVNTRKELKAVMIALQNDTFGKPGR